ncbi:hypothetical protein B0H16DRAFT_185276 [Mycena metata]|uniref:C3H1-type domain-containing protein n=1 Tax=Mycena metata TaxID=1033252 RepID=A0AAD7JVE9_9AGAR|nr:hypothetical protein B0H16DRAFT_185276 [Mycena metata]
MQRPRKQCIFFQEGRCRYGSKCHFSHYDESIQVSPNIPIYRSFETTSQVAGTSSSTLNRSWMTPPRPAVYQPGLTVGTPTLVEAINVLRRSANKAPLDRTNRFFEILEVAICRLEEEELEEATQGLIDSFPFEYPPEPEEEDEDEDDYEEYRSGSDDDGFGDMDLFSPLKKTTPEYEEPRFSARQTASYERNSYSLVNGLRRETFFDWDLLENVSVLNLKFGPNFSIEDSHVAGLAARPEVCQRLQRFAAGDPGTGCGGDVRNEGAFIQFVRRCSSMRVFRLEAFTTLSDATLLAIFEACPRIEMVQLTGHDKAQGRLTGSALKTLARTPAWAPRLKAMYLYDQSSKIDAGVKALSAARPTVWISTGETVGTSMSAV